MLESKINLAKFSTETYFHVFNRTNNNENLFEDEKDHSVFLNQYTRYLLGYTKCVSFCLIKNHFHFLIKCGSVNSAIQTLKKSDKTELRKVQINFLTSSNPKTLYPKLIETQFRKMFTAYALYFNKKYKRKGNLFYRPYKRVEILNDKQLRYLFFYIHNNPSKHGINDIPSDHFWSSYSQFTSKEFDFLDRKLVKEIFISESDYYEFHKSMNMQ